MTSEFTKVSKIKSPTDDLCVVEFERHQGDLGVSPILRSEGDVGTKREAWQWFSFSMEFFF